MRSIGLDVGRHVAEVAIAEPGQRTRSGGRIGASPAVGLVALIGDIGRFPRLNKLVSYLGLDPRVHQSGGRPAWIGHISRAGQSHARRLLCEAAHAAIRVPGPLHAFHLRVARRRGPGIAIIAVAPQAGGPGLAPADR